MSKKLLVKFYQENTDYQKKLVKHVTIFLKNKTKKAIIWP